MGQPFSRRQLLQRASLLGALLALPGRLLWAESSLASRPIPWRNWSGAQSCLPLERLAPKNLDELIQAIRQAPGKIRPVGSGHSFSALVPTDGTLLSLSHFSGLLEHDTQSLQAEFAGGTPMSQMGAPLKEVGQALVNMADIDYQTLAGAIATSTHGTGVDFGSYSAQVCGLQLVSAAGDVLDCSRDNNSALFDAARVSLGALGWLPACACRTATPIACASASGSPGPRSCWRISTTSRATTSTGRCWWSRTPTTRCRWR